MTIRPVSLELGDAALLFDRATYSLTLPGSGEPEPLPPPAPIPDPTPDPPPTDPTPPMPARHP